MLSINFVVNLFLHLLILFTFLIVFFQFYLVQISRNNAEHEISVIVKDLVRNAVKVDPKLFQILNTVIPLPLKQLRQEFDRAEPSTQVNNEWLIRTLNIMTILFWVVFVVFVYILSQRCDEKIHFKELIIENVLVFSVVGVVEVLFFLKVALKYVPIQPSETVKYIENDVKQILSA